MHRRLRPIAVVLLAVILAVPSQAAAQPSEVGDEVTLAQGPSAIAEQVSAAVGDSTGTVYVSDGAHPEAAFLRTGPGAVVQLGPAARYVYPFFVSGTAIAATFRAGRYEYHWRKLDGTSGAFMGEPQDRLLTASAAGAIVEDCADSVCKLVERRLDGATRVFPSLPPVDGSRQYVNGAVADARGILLDGEDGIYYLDYTDASQPRLVSRSSDYIPATGHDDGPRLAMNDNFLAYVNEDVWADKVELVRVDRRTGAQTRRDIGPDIPTSIAISDTTSAWTRGHTGVSTAPADPSAPATSIAGEYQPGVLFFSGAQVVTYRVGTLGVAGFYSGSPGSSSLTRLYVGSPRALRVGAVALTAGRVAYADDRSLPYRVSERDFSRSNWPGLSTERLVATPATLSRWDADILSVSGDRTLYLEPDPGKPGRVMLRLATSGQATRTLAAGLLDVTGSISGPRVLYRSGDSTYRLFDLATQHTAVLPSARSYDLWGPFLVSLEMDGSIRRRDLRAPAAKPGVVVAPGDNCGSGKVQTAGSKILYYGASCRPMVLDVETGRAVTLQSLACDGCDGYGYRLAETAALWSGDLGIFAVPLDGSQATMVASHNSPAFDVEGDTMAYGGVDGQPKIAPLPFETSAAPRYLGGIVPAHFVPSQGWRPELTFSKDLSSCAVTIRRGATAIRSLPCATRYGVAKPVWDGRDHKGAVVPNGTYSFAVAGTAADGDGPALPPSGAGPATSGSVTKGVPVTLTIGSSSKRVTYGAAITVSGRFAATVNGTAVSGQAVDLYHRPAGTTKWLRAGSARSDAKGGVTIRHRPSAHTEYVLQHGGSGAYVPSSSPVLPVLVNTAVTAKLSSTRVRPGMSVKLTGTVSPNHGGQLVQMQRLDAKGWRLIKTAKLTKSSSYSFTITQRQKGAISYRVHKPADKDHAAGPSPTVKLTVY
jgi:hypothetical protein